MSNLTHTIEKTKQIPHNKIPEEKVNRIREFCLTGTRADAAKKYGVSFGFVWRITKELSKRRKVPQDTIEGELWKGVPGYEDYYEVSDCGRIRSFHTGRIMGTGLNNWYRSISLCKNGTKKSVCVHQVVAKVFIPNPENKPCVNHIDGDKTNNHVSNLEWATFKENELHSYRKLGKYGNPSNLKNFSEEWLKEPLRVGSVHFRGENQKKLYELVSKGVLGSKVLEMGHKRQDLYDFIAKLKIGGIAVEKKLVGKPRKSTYKTPMTDFFYKIISQ